MDFCAESVAHADEVRGHLASLGIRTCFVCKAGTRSGGPLSITGGQADKGRGHQAKASRFYPAGTSDDASDVMGPRKPQTTQF